MDVDGAAVAEGVAPHLLEDALTRLHPAGVGEQEGEQVELLEGQLDLRPGDVHGARRAVEAEVAEVLDLGATLAAAVAEVDAADQRQHPRLHLAERVRPGDADVGAGAQAAELLGGVVLPGQHQDGSGRLLAERGHQLGCGRVREAAVEDERVGLEAVGDVDRLGAARRLGDGVALLRERGAQGPAPAVVGDRDQDPFGHRAPPPLPPTGPAKGSEPSCRPEGERRSIRSLRID